MLNKGATIIPARNPDAVTGSQFIQANLKLVGSPRWSHILTECILGNIPDHLRHFKQVTSNIGANYITYVVMPDVLSIGSNDDFCRVPMDPHTAQYIATKYDCTLPTVRMVNDIWKASPNKLAPHPMNADADMSKTYRFNDHNAVIQQQMLSNNFNVSDLTSGHKKDVVLTNYLSPNNHNKRVAIYGWMQLNGQPIQPLNPASHADYYEDYSHGIRLIANDCLVNDSPMRMKDVFAHPVYSALVSNEGPLTFTSY